MPSGSRRPATPFAPASASAVAFGAASLALLLLTPAPAPADITAANWVNNTLFNYRVTHMPDLDQKRLGMVDINGDSCGGTIHCVPTCATNMVMYSANHGFPGVDPGPGYWEGDSNYDLATDTIEDMGLLMQTSCDGGGTGGGNANAGLAEWLDSEPGLLLNDHLSIGAFSPTHESIGKSLCAGRIGSVSYGRYDVVGFFLGTPRVERDGGHCTTAVKVRRNGATRELWVRDPASDEGDDTSQSDFFNTIWTVTDLGVIVMPDNVFKTMTAINYTPGDEVIRLIDGHRTITPAQGYSWDSSLGAIVYLGPMNLLNPTAPPSQNFPSPTGTPVMWLAWHDVTNELLVLCAGANGGTLHAVDPLTHTSHPIPTKAPPELLATGPGDDVYYVTQLRNVRITSYSISGAVDDPTPPLLLPFAAHVMAFDDARNDLVFISRTDRKLMRTPKSLAGPVLVHNIPTFVPLGLRLQIAINPRENDVVYLWSDASNTIWRLQIGAGGIAAAPVNLPAAPQPRSLDFDNRGHMLVNNNGTLIEFQPNSTGGWMVVPPATSLFAGLPAGSNFRITRSRSNFTPGVHDTPGWTTNIDPADLPVDPQAGDCPGDVAPLLDADDVVDVDDLILIILRWGPCASPMNCPGDTNDSNEVDVDDLINVILGWGECPQ